MSYDDVIVDESENYKSGEVFGFRELSMRQLSKVMTCMSQEMRPGFWIYSQSTNQQPQRLRYVGDSRQEFFNSLNVLHDVLKPKFDVVVKEKSKEIYEKIKALREETLKKQSKSSIEDYYEKKIEIYRELFQELCEFLDRLGWLEASSIEN